MPAAAAPPQAPEFLKYSPADVLDMGKGQGLDSATIAQGLINHRNTLEEYGRTQPEAFWDGMLKVDNDTADALAKLQKQDQQAVFEKSIGDPRDQEEFIYQMAATGYDPDLVEERFKPVAQKIEGLWKDPAYKLPTERVYGGSVKVGETPLAWFDLRRGAADGKVDVRLSFGEDSGQTGKQSLIRLDDATPEDVRSEIAKSGSRKVKLMADLDSMGRQFFYTQPDPLGTAAGPQAMRKARRDLAAEEERLRGLKTVGPHYLLGERVRDELKDPKWRDKVGDVAGWTEFSKGIAGATISAGALAARLMDDEGAMRKLAEGQATLDTAYPGSTRRELEGGLWNESVKGGQQALGQMAPYLAGGVVARGLGAAIGPEEVARQAAGRLGTAGAGMSASASGSAYLDSERQMQAALQEGDVAKAERIRKGRDWHALLTGITEGTVERLGAMQMLRGTKGGFTHLAKELGQEALEEPITGVLQRGVVDPVTIDQHPDVLGPVPQETLTGLLAAVPLVGMNAAVHGSSAAPSAPAGGSGPGPVAAPQQGAPISPLMSVAARGGNVAASPGSGGVTMEALLNEQQTRQQQEQRMAAAMVGEGPPSSLALPASVETAPTELAPLPAAPSASRVKMAEKILTTQGVNTEVAQAWAPVLAGQQSEDLSTEDFRDAVLGAFAENGGELPGSVTKAFVEDAAAYEAAGYSAEEAKTHAANARTANAQAVEESHQRNQGLDLGAAYQQARQQQRGLSVPIAAVYEAAKTQDPALTPEQFQTAVEAGGASGSVVLASNEMQGAPPAEGGLTVSNARGEPASHMMMAGALESWADSVIQFHRGRVNANVDPVLVGAWAVRGAVHASRGLVNFAEWSAQMLKDFGKVVRPYLNHLWEQASTHLQAVQHGLRIAMPTDAAKNVRLGQKSASGRVRVSRQGALVNPFARLKGGTMVFHDAGTPFRVNELTWREILIGSPLPSALANIVSRTQNEKRAVEQSAAQIGRDLQASIDSVVDRTGMPVDQINQRVNDMLNGSHGAHVILNALDPTLHERTRRARNMLDDLSTAAAQTLPNGPLRAAIIGNLGSWMQRAYAAFDPSSGWNYDSVTAAAAAGRQVAGRPARQIITAARAYLRAQNPGATTAEIEADMRALMDRNQWTTALAGPGGVSRGVGSLMRRASIAPEIRALMGEETNPLKRFIGSASFQSQFIARFYGQQAMRTAGLAGGLFQPSRGGVFTEQIPPDGARWSGMAGLWTTPQLWTALQRGQGLLVNGTDLGGKLIEMVKAIGNEAKYNKVVLNPDSWMVNILGNFASSIQSGDLYSLRFVSRMRRAAGIVGAGRAKSGAQVNAAAEAIKDAHRDMAARLTGMGVLGSTLTLGDLEASLPRHLLQWMAIDQQVNRTAGAVKGAIMGQGFGRALGTPGRLVGGAVGAVAGAAAGATRIQGWQQKVASWVMTGPDALTRTMGFLTNYETGLAAGMAPDASMEWAATRTLNTYPNYSALPAPMRALSQLGFMQSFLAFQYEVYRNFFWNTRYAWEDMTSGNPALMQRGLQRLAGIGSVAGLLGGGLAYALGATGAAGGDDERNQKYRKWFGAPWEKQAVLAFTKFDKNGVSYYNTSYLLPQTTIAELVQSVREGENPKDSAERVVGRLLEQFMGGSVHVSPILNALANQKRSGAPITYRDGVEGGLDRADSVVQNLLESGLSAKVERLIYAAKEAKKNGKSFSIEQEFKRLVGFREVTYNWDELSKRVYFDMARRNSNIRSDANRKIGENLPGASERAIKEANEKIAAMRVEVAAFEKDAKSLGVPSPMLSWARKQANFGRIADIALGRNGRVVSVGR